MFRDPVAKSIHNEQMRDAAPSPEEAKKQVMEKLKARGCFVCGEDDPQKLGRVSPFPGHCMVTNPPKHTIVACEYHKDQVRKIYIRNLLQVNSHVVEYECGQVVVKDLNYSNPSLPISISFNSKIPKIDIVCSCEGDIERVHTEENHV